MEPSPVQRPHSRQNSGTMPAISAVGTPYVSRISCWLLTTRLMIPNSGRAVFTWSPKGPVRLARIPGRPPTLLPLTAGDTAPVGRCVCACRWGLDVSRLLEYPSSIRGCAWGPCRGSRMCSKAHCTRCRSSHMVRGASRYHDILEVADSLSERLGGNEVDRLLVWHACQVARQAIHA